MNATFKKAGKNMALDFAKPFFQEEYLNCERKFGRDDNKGIPRIIMATTTGIC